MFNQEKGITLVIVVITIIILIILAGMTINLLMGENGIVTKAHQATEEYKEKSKEEEMILNILGEMGSEGTQKIIGIYSVKGKTNTSSDRDVLKDYSGNGNDIKLINFLWNETSGYSAEASIPCLRFSTSVMNRGNNVLNQGPVRTLLLCFTPKTSNCIVFDSRRNSTGNGLALYTNSGGATSVAWNARTAGVTSYINGVKQPATVQAGAKSEQEMLNQRHVICLTAPSPTIEAGPYSIGNRIGDNLYPGILDFYSMMTFSEVLSDQEIQQYSEWMLNQGI